MRHLVSLFVVSMLFVLAGCGSKPAPTPAPAASESKPAPKQEAPKPAEPTKVSVKHVLGTTELPAPAKRVVVLEWTYAEDLLAVGVQPVGSADIANYKKWVNVTCWENGTTACRACNSRKDARTPAQAGMVLHAIPRAPTGADVLRMSLSRMRNIPELWLPYLPDVPRLNEETEEAAARLRM